MLFLSASLSLSLSLLLFVPCFITFLDFWNSKEGGGALVPPMHYYNIHFHQQNFLWKQRKLVCNLISYVWLSISKKCYYYALNLHICPIAKIVNMYFLCCIHCGRGQQINMRSRAWPLFLGRLAWNVFSLSSMSGAESPLPSWRRMTAFLWSLEICRLVYARQEREREREREREKRERE